MLTGRMGGNVSGRGGPLATWREFQGPYQEDQDHISLGNLGILGKTVIARWGNLTRHTQARTLIRVWH